MKSHIDHITSAYMTNVCSNYTNSLHEIIYNKIPPAMFKLGVQKSWDVRWAWNVGGPVPYFFQVL